MKLDWLLRPGRLQLLHQAQLDLRVVFLQRYGRLLNTVYTTLQITAGYRLQVTGYRLQVTDYRLHVTGYRLQVTGYRLQVADYRLQQVASHMCLESLKQVERMVMQD